MLKIRCCRAQAHLKSNFQIYFNIRKLRSLAENKSKIEINLKIKLGTVPNKSPGKTIQCPKR